MSLIKLECSGCGQPLKKEDGDYLSCEYCGSVYKMEDLKKNDSSDEILKMLKEESDKKFIEELDRNTWGEKYDDMKLMGCFSP